MKPNYLIKTQLIFVFLLAIIAVNNKAIEFEDIAAAAKKYNITQDQDQAEQPQETKIPDQNEHQRQYITACIQLGIAFEKQKKYTQALDYYKKALTIDTDQAEIHYHIAHVLRQLEQLDAALVVYQKANTLDPNHLGTLCGLAHTLNLLDRSQEALSFYLKALELKPTATAILYNIGSLLNNLGYTDKAIEIYHKVLEQKPDDASAHFSLARAYLSIGDFERGWNQYQWRSKALNETLPECKQPVWNGSDLKDKTLLIYGKNAREIFQFIRYAKLIKEQGAQVIFQAPSFLTEILSLCPYLDHVISQDDPVPHFDVHIPLISLPLIFKTRLESIPAHVPYLHADKNLEESYRSRLAKNQPFKIGLCWQATRGKQTAAVAKSIPLEQLAPLLDIEGIELYTLQTSNDSKEIGDIKALSKMQSFESDQTNDRFTDTAARMKNLDLIISIDSWTAHLAGGLGLPVWVMLPYHADWCWLSNRTDSPWYPTMRLFRQSEPGNWHSVLALVAQELTSILQQGCQDKDADKLAPDELIDQITQCNIAMEEKKEDMNQIAQYNHDHLYSMYQEYVRQYPELAQYAQHMEEVNKQLAWLEEKRTHSNQSVFDPQYIDIVRKACYAYDIKTNIKKKIKALVENQNL